MDFSSKEHAEIAQYIRFWLGNLPTSFISDDTILFIIDNVDQANPSYTGCDLTYYSTIEILRWLSRKQEQGSAGSSGSGAIKKRSESAGGVSVTVEYDVGVSSGEASGWGAILEDLLNNPNSIGCAITTSEADAASTGNMVIGGVSVSERERVNSDLDSFNGKSYERSYSATGNPYPSSRWFK